MTEAASDTALRLAGAGEAPCCRWEPPASRCFDVEVSADEKALRCGLAGCSCGAPWRPNTSPNADKVARHVCDATDRRVAELCAARASDALAQQAVLATRSVELADKTAMVVVLLELDDTRCSMAAWLPSVLTALYPAKPSPPSSPASSSPQAATTPAPPPAQTPAGAEGGQLDEHLRVVVRRFRSRKQLLQTILMDELHPLLHPRHSAPQSRLSSSWPAVLVMLSTHASTQGQVFSCTPHDLVEQGGFEEFCSLHDLVVTCQHAIGKRLCGVHVSACFVMRLSSIHTNWPVRSAWYTDGTLRVPVSGAANEVYYTGSQTADVFLVASMLARALRRAASFATGEKRKMTRRTTMMNEALATVVAAAQEDLFPDLCAEMGLTLRAPSRRDAGDAPSVVCAEHAPAIASADGGREDSFAEEPVVHPARVIVSTLAAVLVASEPDDAARYADALARNARSRPDVVVDAQVVEPSGVPEAIAQHAARGKRPFVVLLDVLGAHSGLLEAVQGLAQAAAAAAGAAPSRDGDQGSGLYGVLCAVAATAENHQALNLLAELADKQLRCAVVAMQLCPARPEVCFPLLQYFVQLAVGENGIAQGAKLYKPFSRAHRTAWELLDVHRECCAVCPGLAAQTRLRLVAPASEVPPQAPAAAAAPAATTGRGGRGRGRGKGRGAAASRLAQKRLRSESGGDSTYSSSSSSSAYSGSGGEESPQKQRRGAKAEAVAEEDADTVVHVADGQHAVVSPEYTGVDLPLSANMDEVLLPHLELKMHLDFERRVVRCLATYTLEVVPGRAAPPQHVVFDCCDLAVYAVTDADTGEALRFNLSSVLLRVHASRQTGVLPRRVAIEYSTLPRCRSVLFVPDADNKPCCFTCGSPMNNRSWLPGADCERTLLRYDAEVSVPDGAVAIWSAPQAEPPCLVCSPGEACRTLYRFRMDYALPPSTIAFAVGWFSHADVPGMPAGIPATLYAPPSLIGALQSEYGALLPRYARLIVDALGEFPFARNDVAIMPPCLGALGWQNPNVTFLSHTMLAGDQSMAIRFVHELVHNYFGLLFSESDWYEVWLSEGFTEYVCERIYYRSLGLQQDDEENHIRTASLHRYRVLLNDMSNTDDFFHKLSSSSSTSSASTSTSTTPQPPPQTTPTTEAGTDEAAATTTTTITTITTVPTTSTASETTTTTITTSSENKQEQEEEERVKEEQKSHVKVIERCLEPTFHQIYYHKGYFLLRWLATMVGTAAFDTFLKHYVAHFRDQLITGREALGFFFAEFPQLLGAELNPETICSEWIESKVLLPHVDGVIRDLCCPPGTSNPLIDAVDEVMRLCYAADSFFKLHQTLLAHQVMEQLGGAVAKQRWDTAQYSLCLERLYEGKPLSAQTLECLQSALDVERCNADVRHCWCSLVVKNRASRCYGTVEHLLVHDQAMGLYVFAMLVHGSVREQAIARRVYSRVQCCQDPQTHMVMRSMLQNANLIDAR